MHGTEPKLLKLQDPEKEIGLTYLMEGRKLLRGENKTPTKLKHAKGVLPKNHYCELKYLALSFQTASKKKN